LFVRGTAGKTGLSANAQDERDSEYGAAKNSDGAAAQDRRSIRLKIQIALGVRFKTGKQ
jgi:hypothetical protein